MNVHIRFGGDSVSTVDPLYLEQLADIIRQECDIPVTSVKRPVQLGEKDAGITIALTMIGLGVSAISALISILAYLKSQEPRVSISVTRGSKTVTLENIDPQQLQAELLDTETAISGEDLDVLISPEE